MKRETKLLATTLAAALAFGAAGLSANASDDDDDWRGKGWRHHMDGRYGMPGWGRMGRGPDDGPGFMMRFGVIDDNDDGRISDEEAAAQREAVFVAMDADDDGELTQEEYMEVRMGPGEGRNEERRKARQEAKLARFKPMDSDNSGKVSKAEWMAAGKKRFEDADADKDGVVTPWEFRSQHRD
jgi:hypothetical protein